jgi:hypothetical protein
MRKNTKRIKTIKRKTVNRINRKSVKTVNRKNRKTKKINKRKKYGGNECKYENTDPDWNENKNWPVNYGCAENTKETEIILPVGKILDRIGWAKGYFLGEPGYSYDSRSLRILKKNQVCKEEYDNDFNKGVYPNRIEYHQYSVMKPFSAMMCSAKPFFGHKGGSVQYRLFEQSLTDPDDQSTIREKNDVSDADGNMKTNVKVPTVEELIMLGYISETPIMNPPDFM